jgi:hypothetical protein
MGVMMGVRDKNSIEVYFEKTGETEKAILVTDGVEVLWLPKSQITFETVSPHSRDIVVVIPEWLAKEKGIV